MPTAEEESAALKAAGFFVKEAKMRIPQPLPAIPWDILNGNSFPF